MRRLSLRGAIDRHRAGSFKLDNATAPHYQPLRGGGPDRDAASRVVGVISDWKPCKPVIVTALPESALRSFARRVVFTAPGRARPPKTVGVESYGPYYQTAVSRQALWYRERRNLCDGARRCSTCVCWRSFAHSFSASVHRHRPGAGLVRGNVPVLREGGNPQGIVFETAIRNGAGVLTPHFEPDACSWFRSSVEVCRRRPFTIWVYTTAARGARPVLRGCVLPCFVSR